MTRLRHRRERRGALGSIAVVLSLAASMLVGPLVTASPASAAKLTGFGDPLVRWQAAFPRDSVGCDASSCYGPRIRNSSSNYEFTYISTARGRVDGFDLALPRGTTYLKAQLEIAQLFPNDIEMGSLNVIHHDTDGNACAVYNLQSKTLAKVFGKKAFGNSNGTVGVELARVLPNGNTIYKPQDVDLAIVVPTYLGYDASC